MWEFGWFGGWGGGIGQVLPNLIDWFEGEGGVLACSDFEWFGGGGGGGQVVPNLIDWFERGGGGCAGLL